MTDKVDRIKIVGGFQSGQIMVRAADYDALAAKLAEVEAERRKWQANHDTWMSMAKRSNAKLEEAQERIEELEAACEVVSSEFEGDLWVVCRRLLRKTGFDFNNPDGVQAADFEEHMNEVFASNMIAGFDPPMSRPYMGQIMAECDCSRMAECEAAQRCLAAIEDQP